MCDIPDPPPPANFENHRRQDYQSLLMHVEAVRLLHRDPNLIDRLRASLERWRETADPRTLRLFDQWQQIIELRDWPSALSPSERGAQLRQASPMATLLDQQTRMQESRPTSNRTVKVFDDVNARDSASRKKSSCSVI